MPRTSPTIRLLIGLGFLAFTPVLANPPDTRPVIGLRDHTPAVHALAHARIVLGPGRVVDRGTLVVRDGAIIEVGADVAVPADARIWDLTGKTIYPGLIDAYAEVPLTSASGGAPYWNSLVTPQGGVASQYTTDSATNEKLRKQGFVARLIAPQGGIIKGTSALVTTRGAGGDRDILQANVALHVRLGVPRGRSRDAYPNSPMGAVALARQAFYDAQWYGQAWGAFAADSRLPRPERNDALAALQPFAGGRQSVVFDAANELYFLRADAFAREFSLQAVIRGSGQEYQRLDAIRATGRPVIVPVNFPRPPVVDSPEAAADVELHELLHWDLAPENPARLSAAGVTMAFTSSGLRDVADFLAGIRTAVERGLARDAALASLTSVPAQLFGAANRLGTLDAGKGAHLFVTDGDLFDKKTKILETWVDGVRFEIQSPPPFDARGEWRLTATAPRPSASGGETPTTEYGVVIKGTPSQLQGTLQVPGPDGKSQDVKLNKLAQRDLRLTGTFEAKALGTPGIAQFSGTIILVDPAAPTISGTTLFPDGQTWTWAGTRTGQHKSSPADKPQPDS
ncbi:MAG: amidohydrolase family protein, partial [Pirellulaceae bacterium]